MAPNRNTATAKTEIEIVEAEPLALSVKDALKRVPIGRTAFYAGVKNGEKPSVKIGGRVLIPVAALEKKFGSDA